MNEKLQTRLKDLQGAAVSSPAPKAKTELLRLAAAAPDLAFHGLLYSPITTSSTNVPS